MQQLETGTAFGLLNHYDYARLDKECSCALCEEYRQTLSRYQAVLGAIAGHQEKCECDMCKDHQYRARSSHIAAYNRRDLYCESSFHAAIEPRLGKSYMKWIKVQIQMGYKGRTQGWWERNAHMLPMNRWFSQFWRDQQATAALSASGAA